jgi:membrane fusion protein, multidrug efflux system
MKVSTLLGLIWLVLTPTHILAEVPLAVEIITAKTVTVVHEIKVVGAVEAKDSFPASFRRGGQIDYLDAEVGRQLRAGEVIARIDATNISAALDAARANLNAAEAAWVQAEQARARMDTLLARGVGTQAQYDEAQQAFLAAQASRDQARAMLETAEQALDDTEIRAEDDVTVIEKFVDLGEVVSAGAPVATLALKGKKQAVFLAPDAAGLSKILNHEVELDPSGADGPFTSKITEVLPVLTSTGTVEIHADIPEATSTDIPIGASISGRATIEIDQRIVLPWSALTADSKGPAVWVVDPETSTVSLKSVRVGSYNDMTVELTQGLDEGDLVVGAGSQMLFDGRPVVAGETKQ